MHNEKIMIPWKVNENLDVEAYQVAKRGFEKIKKMYYRPVLKFGRDKKVKSVPNMSYFLVLRKEIHLIFESICDKNLVLKEFERNEHLLVKEAYLSMHNIEEIISAKLVHLLEQECYKFTQHFQTCPVV